MLDQPSRYIPDQSPVLARDMNTLGDVVRMLNNMSGPDVFIDSTTIAFRRPPIPAVVEEDAPEYYGQVHIGVANLTPGWSLLPLVNVTP